MLECAECLAYVCVYVVKCEEVVTEEICETL